MTGITTAFPAVVSGRLFTADELLALPDSKHLELIEGHIRAMAPTGDEHGRRTIRLSVLIGSFVYDNDLGECFAAETGFLLARNPDTVKAPDFAFIAKERLDFPRGRGFVPVAPDLVLETRSPSDRSAEVDAKIAEWLRAGVRMALDLDPQAKTIRLHRPDAEPVLLTADDTFDGGDVLPGFVLSLRRLFP